MLTEKFMEVIAKEGAVSIVTWGEGEPHVSNTWNSYLVVTEDQRLLIPAAGMIVTEKNIDINNKVKLTLGNKEVMGLYSSGAGFLIEGTARFIESGSEYDLMHEKFPFLRKVLEISITSLKQTL